MVPTKIWGCFQKKSFCYVDIILFAILTTKLIDLEGCRLFVEYLPGYSQLGEN